MQKALRTNTSGTELENLKTLSHIVVLLSRVLPSGRTQLAASGELSQAFAAMNETATKSVVVWKTLPPQARLRVFGF